MIREGAEPPEIARVYEDNGARAISVLTDGKYFGGKLGFIQLVKQACGLPVLRKEFILDEYQVLESAFAGADAILLIVRLLDDLKLKGFISLAHSLQLDCLVEVHDEKDLETALGAGADIIGINNRDLDTLEISLDTTLRLKGQVPEGKVVVSESGIRNADDIGRLKGAGVHAFLIGETLMKAPDMGACLKGLLV
jgi:indole-3-glycerol phosphate synthase